MSTVVAVPAGRGNESGTEEVQTSGRPAGEANAGEKPVQNGKKSPAFRRGEPLSGSRNGEGRPANLSLRELTNQLLSPTRTGPEAQEAGGRAAAGGNGKQTERQREAESTEEETQSSREPGAESESEHETEEGKAAEGSRTPKPGGEADAPEGEEAEGQEGAEGEGNEEPAEEPARAELPEEVKEAIEIAKAQDGGKGKAQLLKRVHKLVDERDTHRNMRLAAEEQNHQLRSELQDLAGRAKANGSSPDGATSHPEVQQVAQEIQQVDAWLNWLEENPDGGSVTDAQGKAFDVPAGKVARMTRELGNARSELVARKASTETAVRQAMEAAYQQFHTRAVEVHPWLKESKSPEYQRMTAILNALPQLKGFPDHELLIGFMFAGEKAAALAAQANNKKSLAITKKVPATREPPRVVAEAPARGASRTGQGGRGAKTEESLAAEEEFQKTGSVRALGQMFAAKARGARTNKS